jgi:hypothetical protein
MPSKAAISSKGRRGLPKATSRRTTIALSPDAAEIVERFQSAADLSLSEAVSILIERSEQPPVRIKYCDGWPMADIPLDGDWITNEDVLRAEAELW